MKSEPEKINNEMDVREDIITPLLHRLGYKSGSRNNIIREQLLRYPKLSLGRKKPKKDPELRGKADYILEVDGRLRWVLEAKPPAPPISADDIEQAWTYAKHPEVRAIFFALCNGYTFQVYRTDHAPGANAVLSLDSDFEEDFRRLENLLGPQALLRDFPDTKLEIGIPIGPGLRSIARITGGMFSPRESSLGVNALQEMQWTVREGSVERDEFQHLTAFLATRSPLRSLQEFNERMGLANFEMMSEDAELSLNIEKPTVFTYYNNLILPRGEKILNPVTWQYIELPTNITCSATARACGSYQDRTFSGTFKTTLHYKEIELRASMSGDFEIHLA